MPAHRIQDKPSSIKFADIAGQDAACGKSFIGHVGISIENRDDLTNSSRVLRLAHMGPPLQRDTDDVAQEIDVVGSTELSADEQSRIELFIDELEFEYESEKARPKRQYIIKPHFVADDEDKFPFPRFSCGGFVIEAYRDIEIDLLKTDAASLPVVNIETLIKAYPDHERRLRHRKLRAMYGLEEDGPWPVVLSGYVCHALNRSSVECRSEPYGAQAGDEYFPSWGRS
jgi:hypothetical protein